MSNENRHEAWNGAIPCGYSCLFLEAYQPVDEKVSLAQVRALVPLLYI